MTTDGMRSICSLTEKTTESPYRLRLEDRTNRYWLRHGALEPDKGLQALLMRLFILKLPSAA